MLAPQPSELILDLGCGIGQMTARLAATGARVIGLDILGTLLEQARFAYPGLEFIEGDLLSYKPRELFDGVFARATLSWIRPPEEAAASVFRCLKSGGRLAATLGGGCETARQLDGYFAPDAKSYTALLGKIGFREIEMETANNTLFVYARRPA